MTARPLLKWKSSSAGKCSRACNLIGSVVVVFQVATAEAQTAPAAVDTTDSCLADALCRAHYLRARNLSKEANHEAALAAYQAAYRRRPTAWMLLSIGRTLHKLGHPEDAMASYRKYQEQVANPPADLSTRLREYIAEAEEEIAAARAAVASSKSVPPSASANSATENAGSIVAPSISAAPAAEVSVAQKAAPSSSEKSLVAAIQTAPAPVVAATAEAGSVRRGPALAATLTVSGVLGVAALVTGIKAWQSYSDAMQTRYVGDTPSPSVAQLQTRAGSLAIATDVLAGAAAGALVIGLLATYLRKPTPALMRTVQLQGTGLLWRFSAL